MKYKDIFMIDQGLAALLDLEIVNGTASLYFKLQRLANAVKEQNRLFQDTQKTALKGVDDASEQSEIINNLLEEEIDIELLELTYDELEKFQGMTFKTISLLEPILEKSRSEVVEDNIMELLQGDD